MIVLRHHVVGVWGGPWGCPLFGVPGVAAQLLAGCLPHEILCVGLGGGSSFAPCVCVCVVTPCPLLCPLPGSMRSPVTTGRHCVRSGSSCSAASAAAVATGTSGCACMWVPPLENLPRARCWALESFSWCYPLPLVRLTASRATPLSPYVSAVLFAVRVVLVRALQ